MPSRTCPATMSAAVTTAGSSARATAVEPVTSTTSAPFSWSEDEPAPSNAATGTTNLGGPRRSLPGWLVLIGGLARLTLPLRGLVCHQDRRGSLRALPPGPGGGPGQAAGGGL